MSRFSIPQEINQNSINLSQGSTGNSTNDKQHIQSPQKNTAGSSKIIISEDNSHRPPVKCKFPSKSFNECIAHNQMNSKIDTKEVEKEEEKKEEKPRRHSIWKKQGYIESSEQMGKENSWTSQEFIWPMDKKKTSDDRSKRTEFNQPKDAQIRKYDSPWKGPESNWPTDSQKTKDDSPWKRQEFTRFGGVEKLRIGDPLKKYGFGEPRNPRIERNDNQWGRQEFIRPVEVLISNHNQENNTEESIWKRLEPKPLEAQKTVEEKEVIHCIWKREPAQPLNTQKTDPDQENNTSDSPWKSQESNQSLDAQDNNGLDKLLIQNLDPIADKRRDMQSLKELFIPRRCDLPEVHIDEIDKSSDVSDFAEDDGPYREENPLDAGWEYAIFMGHYPIEGSDNSRIEVYTKNGVYKFDAAKQYVDGLVGCTYVRFKTDMNNNYQVYPSFHRHSIMGAVKVRPHKSIECRTIAIVGFNRQEQAPIPVWSEAVGWRRINCSIPGVIRKGLVDMGQEELLRPLRLIEFTIKIKTEIEQGMVEFTYDAVKITDVSPLSCISQDKEDKKIPECCYPKSPKRVNDLVLKGFAMHHSEIRAVFASSSYPNVKFWASSDQCAFSSEEGEQSRRLSGIFIPYNSKEYRGLVVAPIQRLYRMSKGHAMDYKKLPPKAFYKPVTSKDIEMTKRIHSELFNNVQSRNINWYT